jgi:hypothetical protein
LKLRFTQLILISALVLIIASSGFLINISSASGPLSSRSISIFGRIRTDLPSEYDFFFQTDGLGMYNAFKKDGSLAFSSSNASFVFNSALAEGDSFFVDPGNYYLTSPILLDSNTSFIGSGKDVTNFNVAANASTTMWYFNGIDYISGLFNSMAGHNSNISLEGFTINGNTPTYQIGAGIWLENVDNFICENIKINGIYGQGIIANQEDCAAYNNNNYVINNVETYGCALTGGTNICDSITLESISNFSITNVIVNVTGSCGIIVSPHPGGADSFNGFVDNCSVYSSQWGSGVGQTGNRWNFDFHLNHNLTIKNCYSYGSYAQNLIVSSCSEVYITNFTSANSGNWGMNFEEDQNMIVNGLVSYNSGQIKPTSGIGIGIQDCSNSQFLNSQSYSNLLDGWRIGTSKVGTFNIQLINCNGTSNVGNDGVSLYNYGIGTICNSTTISGGTYSGNAYGIDIRVGVTNTLIQGARFGTGNSFVNITDSGIGTTIIP